MVELNDRVNGLQIIPYNMVDAALYFIVFVNLDKKVITLSDKHRGVNKDELPTTQSIILSSLLIL